MGCPACGHETDTPFYRSARHPAVLNRLYESQADALTAARCDLDFRTCSDCGFVFNVAFDPDVVQYGPGYLNDQSCSPAFARYLDDARDELVRAIDGPGPIVEIGCGQGHMLESLARATGRHCMGVDPAFDGRKLDSLVRIDAARFTRAWADDLVRSSGAPSIVICRHVLEHLADPASVVCDIRHLLSEGGLLSIEVPDVDWIRHHGAFYDLFAEHCSLFSRDALTSLLASRGFELLDVSANFGGQYLRVLGRASQASARSLSRPVPVPSCLDTARTQCAAWICERSETVLWGAGAKGVSLLAHLGEAARNVRGVVDIHPDKQGRFAPASGVPIIDPEALTVIQPTRVIVMNPNYEAEVRDATQRLGIVTDVVAVTSAHAQAISV